MRPAAAEGESGQVPPAGPTRPSPERRAPLYVAVGLVAVVGLVGAVAVAVAVWNRRAASSAEAPRPGATPRALDTLTRQLVDTEVEVARAKLGSGDHEEAVRRAERALSLDPADPAALDVRRQARAIQQRQDDAVAGVRAARAADASVAAGALWALLEAAPDHPAGDDLVAGLDASYRPRADEARRLMGAARRRAEEKQGVRLPAFQEGEDLARTGEAALAQRRFAQAARAFMRARARYERAGGALR
jgi:tetratricopeptide (TPR) repeat protein